MSSEDIDGFACERRSSDWLACSRAQRQYSRCGRPPARSDSKRGASECCCYRSGAQRSDPPPDCRVTVVFAVSEARACTGRHARSPSELRLLSGFELRRRGEPVPLPQSAERLAAFLAVQDRALERSQVAGSLWPDVTEPHALGSLRSALWRLHSA